MNVQVMSRKEALAFPFVKGDWLISIRGEKDELYYSRFGRDTEVIELTFDDDSHSMTSDQASWALRWAIRCHAAQGRLFVNCAAGISRSAGIAEALARIGLFDWAERDDKIWQANGRKGARYQPNAHVVSLMLRAAGAPP